MFKKRGHHKQYHPFFARHNLWIATATLMGTIIGAGVLGIPYVIAQSGLLLGIINLLVVGFALLVLHLCLGEITLRTHGLHQLSGYIGKYLGPWGKRFMVFSMMIGVYGALIAYTMGEGEILNQIFNFFLPNFVSPGFFALLFFIVAALIVFFGLKATGRAEMIITTLMILIIFAIGLFAFHQININNFSHISWPNLFLPYGVILFAFVGTAAIPELREELEKDAHKMKKAIFIGSLIPIALYLLFTLIVVGLIGLDQFNSLAPNERIATVALSIFTNSYLGLAANIFAVFSMFTSFIGLGLALVSMFEYDLHFKKYWAFFLTVIPPLIIAFSGLTNFIQVIGFTGAIAGGIDGILIMAAYWQARKYGERKPEYTLKIGKILTTLLVIMFVGGLLYELWRTFF